MLVTQKLVWCFRCQLLIGSSLPGKLSSLKVNRNLSIFSTLLTAWLPLMEIIWRVQSSMFLLFCFVFHIRDADRFWHSLYILELESHDRVAGPLDHNKMLCKQKCWRKEEAWYRPSLLFYMISSISHCSNWLNHRIVESLELEGTIKDHLVPLPCNEQGHLQLHQVAQDLIQPCLGCLQRQGSTTSLGSLYLCLTTNRNIYKYSTYENQ